MNKIPTAEELYNQEYSKIKSEDLVYGYIDEYQAQKMMIEFAKLHVKAQAEEISEKIQAYSVTPVMGGKPRYTRIKVNKESILNVYPEENIK